MAGEVRTAAKPALWTYLVRGNLALHIHASNRRRMTTASMQGPTARSELPQQAHGDLLGYAPAWWRKVGRRAVGHPAGDERN